MARMTPDTYERDLRVAEERFLREKPRLETMLTGIERGTLDDADVIVYFEAIQELAHARPGPEIARAIRRLEAAMAIRYPHIKFAEEHDGVLPDVQEDVAEVLE